MLRNYLRLIIFSCCLLSAIQIPGFIQQYSLISKARLAEAQLNLAGFQQTADKFFGGSLEKLIVYYQQSDDQVMQADGVNIDSIYQRVELLKAETEILTQAEYQIAWHLLQNPNPEVMQQAKQEYTYIVPLNTNAIVWGALVATMGCLLFDLVLSFALLMLAKLFSAAGVKQN
ncbi:DUF2937 family protein [Catenovulum maritimum]|uniref:DUF2937 domain-containing protein n=1 Tax=Catenovulum maritimum TaxID=1513271 RepID=A0A0J8JN69_9ALTE|nr:DUF2937 family protein [Catenovulum maritimum]KMT66046.1 hypothetical protein XM47_06255 [Catenovulum maritimum]